MSLAALLLTLAPAPQVAQQAENPPRHSVAVSVTASARIIRPAIIAFEVSDMAQANDRQQMRPQRRTTQGGASRSRTVWIEFS